MAESPPAARADAPPPPSEEPTVASEYAYARDLLGLISRAPRRRARLAAAVFLIGALASVAAAIFTPRVYLVETKILAQRNLVMPSLGNPRRAVPTDSDAPTRGAADVILGRENLVAIIKELDLGSQWERDRSPLLRLKDRLGRVVSGPLSEEDRERAIVAILEKKLRVQADESTIRISLEWSRPEAAFRIVSTAQRNFFEQRSAAEVAVIADTISILAAEAERQREMVDTAFSRVVALRRDAKAAPQVVAAPALPLGAPRREPARPIQKASAAPASPAPEETKIASRLEEKRRSIRTIEEPRQRRLADLEAQRSRLLLTYTEAHPAVLQVDAEMRALRVDPAELLELRREEQELVAELDRLAAPEQPQQPDGAPERRFTGARPVVPGAAVVVDASPREDEPELASAKAKLVVATRKYEDLMDRVDSARIELYTAQAAFKYRYTVAEPPEVPKKPERPNAPVMAALGIVLSALLAVFAAAVKDLASDRFIEAWQVRRRLPIPLLAEVEKP